MLGRPVERRAPQRLCVITAYEEWRLVALDLGVDTTTPNGEFIANVMSSFAQFERQMIATRTREALQAARQRGVALGRRTAIDEIFDEDAVFYDPNGGVFRGRDEIYRIAGVIKATHPDFRYQPLAPPEELGDGGRVRWVSGAPGKPPAYAGTDFIVARNGRIASVYLFFDKLP